MGIYLFNTLELRKRMQLQFQITEDNDSVFFLAILLTDDLSKEGRKKYSYLLRTISLIQQHQIF